LIERPFAYANGRESQLLLKQEDLEELFLQSEIRHIECGLSDYDLFFPKLSDRYSHRKAIFTVSTSWDVASINKVWKVHFF